ncbi:MAG: hypothetical protein HMLIMOIP_001862 [Candidatus Nitrosomirales archaeon]|jgi:hypothetical protein
MAVQFYSLSGIISAFMLLTVLPNQISVYAPFDENGNYYCDPANIEFILSSYNNLIGRVNNGVASFKVSEPDASIAEQNEYILSQAKIHLNLAGKDAECLSNNGINPDSVAKFNGETQEVLMYDYDRLFQIAPELVKYSTIPEFPVNLMVIAALGLTAALIALRLRIEVKANKVNR